MGRLDSLLQKLKNLHRRAESVRERAFPEDHADGLAPLTREDRPMVIKFMREVYHEGMSEQVWAAKYPDEYRRIVAIAGTVPRKPEA